MTIFSKNFGGIMAPLAHPWLRLCCVISAVRLSKALKDAHSKETSNLHVSAAHC